MSLSGKILAVLNLLAAGAFLYLAVMDYGMRQQWAYAVFRYDLALDGLPVDKNDRDERGRARFEDITPALATELTGSPEGRTQEAALEQRKKELLAWLDSPTAPGSKLDRHVEVLLALAETASEREQLLARQKNQTDRNVDALARRIEDHFTAVKMFKDEKAGGQLKERDRDGKRGEIARMLVALSQVEMLRVASVAGNTLNAIDPATMQSYTFTVPAEANVTVAGGGSGVAALKQGMLIEVMLKDGDPKTVASVQGLTDPMESTNFKRVVGIVGVRALATALDAEARQVQEMADQVADMRDRSRREFSYAHDKLIDELLSEDDKLQVAREIRIRKEEQAVKQEALAKAQKDHVKEVKDELQKVQAETEKALDRLSRKQMELFQVRLLLRDAAERNRKLEEDVRRKENEVKAKQP